MKKIILILVLFCNVNIWAKENAQYKSLIAKSEELLYNFDFEKCNLNLIKAISLEPARPEAYLMKSKIFLWYYLGSKDELDYNSFLDYSDSTIFKIDRMLQQKPEDKNLIYLLGNVYKYRAMAYGTNGNTLDAFWSTKKSVSYYEDVLEKDPKFYSASGGIGIFEYVLSYVPALFNWALTLSGLSANQQNGFDAIKLAAEKGEMDKLEYKFHLSKLYDEHLADYENSLALLKILSNQYPNNLLFQYQLAIELIKFKKLDSALKQLIEIVEINHHKFIQTTSFSYFLIGDIYFRQNNYEVALEYYQKFLTSSQTIDYTGIASLRAAFCNYFLNDEKEYRRYLLLSSNGNHDIEDDKYAHDISQLILEKGFTFDRQILIEVENLYLSGENLKALETIQTNIDSLKNDDIAAQLLVFKSSILIEKNKLNEALNTLKIIDSLTVNYAKWVKPMKDFNQAKIYYKLKNYKLAKEYLALSENNNDYQRKNLIQSYINGLGKKLAKIP